MLKNQPYLDASCLPMMACGAPRSNVQGLAALHAPGTFLLSEQEKEEMMTKIKEKKSKFYLVS